MKSSNVALLCVADWYISFNILKRKHEENNENESYHIYIYRQTRHIYLHNYVTCLPIINYYLLSNLS